MVYVYMGMRRNVLNIFAALGTFTVGFLTLGKFEELAEALPLALCVFVLTKLTPEFRFALPRDFDPHKLKVAAITFVLWIPVLVVYLPLLIPQSSFGNCTPDIR
jgi:hypothetical protein